MGMPMEKMDGDMETGTDIDVQDHPYCLHLLTVAKEKMNMTKDKKMGMTMEKMDGDMEIGTDMDSQDHPYCSHLLTMTKEKMNVAKDKMEMSRTQ